MKLSRLHPGHFWSSEGGMTSLLIFTRAYLFVMCALGDFSFTTLTTTGFGDITPIRPLSRTLAMFEVLTGQLYLVITLARLVSQAIMAQKEKIQNSSRD